MALTWTDLYNEILPIVGAFPKNIALRRLYHGAREFCERSEVWQYSQTRNVVAAQAAYSLSIPSTGAIIKRLVDAWYGEKASNEQAADLIGSEDYYFTYPATFTLYNAYTSALTNGLTTRVALVPSLDDHVLTSEMMDHWGIRAFCSWTVASICSQKDKPWTDSDQAALARGEYSRALAEAISEKNRKRKPGDLRVIPRFFASGNAV